MNRESRKLAKHYERIESDEFGSVGEILSHAEYHLDYAKYGITHWAFKQAAACIDAVDLRILKGEATLTGVQELQWKRVRSHRIVRTELKVWPYPSRPGSTGGEVHWND